MPRVSVIIPAWRPRDFDDLQRSMAANADVDAEWIVVDDGSGASFDPLFARLPGGVRVLRQTENRRQGAARNVGLAAARGQWIKFLDADDQLDAGHLAGLLRAADGTVNASIAISDAADGDFTKVSVRMRRFDDVLAEMGEARFQVVKVDIEGHEDFFLRGAKDWLHRERPIILTEVNNWYFEKRGTTSSEVFSETLPDGYEIMVLDEHAGKGTLSPIRVGELAAAGMIETCVMAPVERISELHQCLG